MIFNAVSWHKQPTNVASFRARAFFQMFVLFSRNMVATFYTTLAFHFGWPNIPFAVSLQLCQVPQILLAQMLWRRLVYRLATDHEIADGRGRHEFFLHQVLKEIFGEF